MKRPGFEPRESEPCGKHCLRLNLLPLWGAVPSTQPVRWALSQHQTKVTGPAEEHGCAWREHGGGKHEGVLLHPTLRNPEAWHRECPTGGVATLELLRKLAWQVLPFWPLAALDSKEGTRTWSQMPDFHHPSRTKDEWQSLFYIFLDCMCQFSKAYPSYTIRTSEQLALHI